MRGIRAGATLAAAIGSFLTVYVLCRRSGAQNGPALLAAILAITLSRRPHAGGWKRFFLAPAMLAATALAATGAAWLLHTRPALGAAAFVGVMFLSVWLRNFGDAGRSAGASLALPLIALLIVPARANAPGGPLVDLALVVCAGIVSLAFATAMQWLAHIALEARARIPVFAVPPAAERRTSGRVSTATRMALQMAVALAAAFVAGFTLFPAHYGWTVLTAFIVSSGARGREDAAYKGVLRLAGAAAGTIVAAALAHVAQPRGTVEAVLIFAVLYAGLWLREINYAYWAACITLVLALLSTPGPGLMPALLAARLEAILVGALCAVGAAWFVFPIRTEAVVRRRLADALAALDTFVAQRPPAEGARAADGLALFEHRMSELESVAAAVRWHRRLFASGIAEHPAHWIDVAHEVKTHARDFEMQQSGRERHGAVRRAIGSSRRAIRDHGTPDAPGDALPVGVALRTLRDLLRSPDDGRKAADRL